MCVLQSFQWSTVWCVSLIVLRYSHNNPSAGTFWPCHRWPFSHLTESFNHEKATTRAPASHHYLWPERGAAAESWVQEIRPALQGAGLCREPLMCCDRRACLSAFPWQRAAKSNANSQAARRAFCLIQFQSPALTAHHHLEGAIVSHSTGPYCFIQHLMHIVPAF